MNFGEEIHTFLVGFKIQDLAFFQKVKKENLNKMKI